MGQFLKRFIPLTIAVLFAIAITVISISPVNRIALGTRAYYSAPAEVVRHAAILHALVHVFIFGAAACLAWYAADFAAKGPTSRMLAVVTTLLLGCTTEYLQHVVYRHPIEVADVALNLTVSGTAFLLLAFRDQIRRRGMKSQVVDHTSFILRDLD